MTLPFKVSGSMSMPSVVITCCAKLRLLMKATKPRRICLVASSVPLSMRSGRTKTLIELLYSTVCIWLKPQAAAAVSSVVSMMIQPRLRRMRK